MRFAFSIAFLSVILNILARLFLCISLWFDSGYFLQFLDGHGHQDSEYMLNSHFKLLSCLGYPEFILLDRISYLILLIALLFIAIQVMLLLQVINDALLFEVGTIQNNWYASFIETTSTNYQYEVACFWHLFNYLG